MAIENKDDKQIVNLLENSDELRCIKVDFKDLNNKTLIIKSSFPEAFKDLNTEENYFYICKLNIIYNSIDVLGLVKMDIENNYLILKWIETNRAFKKKGYFLEIINYLKKYVQWINLKGIITCPTEEAKYLFLKNGFTVRTNCLAWER